MNAFAQLDLFRLPPVAPPPKTRHLLLGGRLVPYVLRQGRQRRRLALTIDERGLFIGAPHGTPLAEIESFAHSHAHWVLAKLAEYTERSTPRQVTVRHGTRLPLLGGEIEVHVEICTKDSINRSLWRDDTLVLRARADADLDHLTRRALQRRALPHFLARVAHFGAHLHRPPPPVALSSARTRWGSCGPHGIRLNWRLIHLAPPLIDYVVAHELAHLTEMNHSSRFWAEVGRLYPGWQAARAELKHRGREMPLI